MTFSPLKVGSFPVYPSHSRESPSWRVRDRLYRHVKQGQGERIEGYINRLVSLYRSELGDFFEGVGSLIPVPGRSRRLPGSLWVPDRIARALHDNGIGESVNHLLERWKPVPPSTGVATGSARPSPKQHIESLRVLNDLFGNVSKVMLIDDFVTRGATLLGCAEKFRQAYPNVDIRAFSLCRVETGRELASDDDMFETKVETIRGDQDTAYRR